MCVASFGPIDRVSRIALFLSFPSTKRSKDSTARTMTEFAQELEIRVRQLSSAFQHSIAISAGCELFKRLVSLTASEFAFLDFDCFKQTLFARGRAFAERSDDIRDKIASLAFHFIQDGTVILVHSYSRVVMGLLLRAARENRRFNVLVTEARPNPAKGEKTVRLLRQEGIPASLILDTAVGYWMKRVDMVLVGAEGVVENGGIINRIGTYQIAVLAKAAGKPFYVVAESYKFVRLFPLDQYDLPSNFSITVTGNVTSGVSVAAINAAASATSGNAGVGSVGVNTSSSAQASIPSSPAASCLALDVMGHASSHSSSNNHSHHNSPSGYSNSNANSNSLYFNYNGNGNGMRSGAVGQGCSTCTGPFGIADDVNNPFVDYTAPSYISLLFTDIGVLTPSGVSDELIKLYY